VRALVRLGAHPSDLTFGDGLDPDALELGHGGDERVEEGRLVGRSCPAARARAPAQPLMPCSRSCAPLPMLAAAATCSCAPLPGLPPPQLGKIFRV
jgi:hypothetical protein